MHHGAANSAFRKTPPVRRATLRTSDSASIGSSLRSGDSVSFLGGWIIDRPPFPAYVACRGARRMAMSTMVQTDSERYARSISASKRVRWEIEDVIRGRRFDRTQKYLPDGLSL